ncbi:MAG TPA: methyltransferase domain-containing protein [bacterium]
MSIILVLVFVLFGLILTALFAWRLASRRCSLPCPARLFWLLDNPFAMGLSSRTKAAIRHLDLKPGMNVLDLGCGPGRLTIPVAEKVGPRGEVVAIDVQAGMLRRARERTEAAGLNNVRFIQAGAGKGKVERGRFDRALLITVLGEILNREAALKEIYGALKPGGFLSVSEVVGDPHFQRRGKVRELAGKIGFKEKACFGNWFAFTLNLEKPHGK